MKRLITTLVVAVAVSTAFARVTSTNDFETSRTDFVADDQSEDASDLKEYADASEKPSTSPVPYLFTTEGYGSKYFELDTGDTTLWCTNSGEATYFDMFMQFNPCATAPEIESGMKIAIFLNSSSNLVVISGPDVTTNTLTGTTLAPGTWGRLTISATNSLFTVSLNGNSVGSFQSLTGDATVQSVGLKGSGALENYVARTTDPFLQNGVAAIGGEFYASYNDALKEALEGAPIAVSNCTTGVVTDGTAEHPYEIADANALKILAAAVQNNPAARSLSYIQTADITWTSADGAFEGIGHYSSTKSERIYFTGVYDGGDHKISGIVLTTRTYASVFNQLHTGAVIKNLTVEDMGFEAGATGEYGCAIVGVCGDSSPSAGSNVLERLAFTQTEGHVVTNTHNCAGIVVNVAGGYAAINDCTNNVDIVCDRDKFGGICCMTGGHIDFNGCVNNGDLNLVARSGYSSSGSNSCGGMLGYMQGGASSYYEDCVNTGTFTDESGNNVAKYGQIFGLAAGSQTINDQGGNIFLMANAGHDILGSFTCRDSGTFHINGFEYAAVDGSVHAGVTVPQADLTTNVEYLVLRPIAASADPIYAFDDLGTISFHTNDYNFAGTVAGSSTVAVTESTSGSVITFKGVAGVASVNDVAYATFDEAMDAVASAPEGHQYVELLADAEVNFDEAGTTLAVKENAHTLTVTTTGDIAVTRTPNASTGIFTYTTADGVAKCNDKWYATFTAAYDAALAASGNAKMVVKITDDFTPAISATYNHFYSLEFIDARADQTEGLTINLKNAAGTAYMASSQYFFPANATLVLAADFSHANATGIISGGTLEIPEGVTVTINVSPYWAFYKLDGSAGISAIAGTGTILLPNNTFDGSTVSKTMFNNPHRCFPSLLRNNSWQGTLELVGTSDDKVCDLSQVANPGSKIRFNGFTAPTFGGNNSTYAMGIELVGDGLTLTGDYTRNYTFTGSLKGSGSLSVANTKPTSLMFTGDVSGFTGNVTVSGSGRVAFGSNKAGTAPVIYVHQGASVTNTGTWTANEIMVTGELVANGTVTGTLKGLTGYAGVYRANASTAAIASDSSWNGTYYANFDSGDVKFAFDVATSASATTVINGANGAFSGYPTSNGAAPNVAGSVVLNANWTIDNGWATNKNTGASNATTFANLSGGGNLTVNGTTSGTDPIYYCITTLDGYTGALGGNRGAFVVGKVNVATQPTNGAIVVKTNIGVNGSINDNVPLYVGGTDTTKTLTYKADGAYGAGLYYIDSTPTDPWNTPSSDAGVADALTLDGLTTESAAVTTVAGFNALVNYIETKLNVTAPDQMTANQKANAVLCYALNATTIPDTVIESATIDAITQPDASGAMTLTVAIAGVTVGETVDPALVATVVSAKGGTSIGSMVAAGVATTNYGSSNGKVVVTVTPAVESGDPAPTTFFTSAVITK